jgi:glycosyltransferase involved in cell wall biosynthesis
MIVILVYLALSISGFILFAKVQLEKGGKSVLHCKSAMSVIIPARNEEKNLPHILGSLEKQTYQPHEIIVVDDFSSDRTREIAGQYNVRVIENAPLPDGWTGKNWAVWNGYLNASGDILVFLDADVRLAPDALEVLLAARERLGGAVSVVPYHHTEKFYERLSLILNILGLFSFTSPFEKRSWKKGLYGSCIITAREDYERIKGHGSVKSELLDDLNLGKTFCEAGIPVNNFIGGRLVSFRMYPGGLKSEVEGFGKGAVLSTSSLMPATIFLIALWVIGLVTVGMITPVFLMIGHPAAFYFLAAYMIYSAQVFYIAKYTGYYGAVVPFLHFIPTTFFVFVMLYSLYKVIFVGSVPWKGRQINIGGRKSI